MIWFDLSLLALGVIFFVAAILQTRRAEDHLAKAQVLNDRSLELFTEAGRILEQARLLRQSGG